MTLFPVSLAHWALPGALKLGVALLALSLSNAASASTESGATPDPAEGPVACVSPLRAQDEMWLVSSRGLGCDVERQASNLRCWHYGREHNAWDKSSLAEFFATDQASVVTIIFTHGNRVTDDEAVTKGWAAYRTLVACADERPVRFVIWSWPSEAIRGPVQDAREKAQRTNAAGYYLAWFLDQIQPDAPVALWGHSFGARVATGALHLLGGGTLAGHRLIERKHPDRQPIAAVLLVAALDCNWLLPGHCQGQAMSQVSRMLLVNNGCDILLRRYHMLYGGRGHEQALGFTGMALGMLPAEQQGKVKQVDACCQIGKEHTFLRYLEVPGLMSQMRPYLLFAASESAVPTSAAEDSVQTGPELARH